MRRFRKAFHRVFSRLRGETVHRSPVDDVPEASESEDVERELDRLVDLYSDFQILPPQGISAQIKNNLGITYAELGEYANAETLFLEAIDLWPGCADACRNLAAVYTETGAYDKAEEFLRREEAIRRNAPKYVLRPEKRAEFRETFRERVEHRKKRGQ